MENALITFEGKNFRKIWHNEEWYFSVVDIIEFLTESSQPSRYWADLKKRSEKESNQSFAFCERLKLLRPDGKTYPTDCANTEGVLRIVMSVPSPKAEPLKLWLAEQGKRTIDETENPELLTERQAELYKAKGYPDEWIQRRMQTIETRKQLTEEWQKRGVKEGQEYSILTATIAKGTFGLTPTEHKELKGLKNENLRDHMTPLELILTALGEEVTRTIAIDDDAQGFNENHDAAVKGGVIANKALKNVEKGTKRKVVSHENYLKTTKKDNELPDNSDISTPTT
jgi:DNA-damage-inducible protein D